MVFLFKMTVFVGADLCFIISFTEKRNLKEQLEIVALLGPCRVIQQVGELAWRDGNGTLWLMAAQAAPSTAKVAQG